MSKINTSPLKNSAIIRIYSERDIIEIEPEYQRKGDI